MVLRGGVWYDGEMRERKEKKKKGKEKHTSTSGKSEDYHRLPKPFNTYLQESKEGYTGVETEVRNEKKRV